MISHNCSPGRARSRPRQAAAEGQPPVIPAGPFIPAGLERRPAIQTAAGRPPGCVWLVRSSSDLSRSLAMPFTSALVPAGLPSPKVSPHGFGTPPRGLLPHPQGDLRVTFGDLDDDLFFYIFDNANHASTWFSNDLRPVDSSGHVDVQRGSLSYPSGFSSSQQAQCGNYYQPGHGSNPAWNVSSCVVQWGNVVIFTRSQVPVNKGKGDINRALALARSGVLRIAQVIAP